MASPIRPVKGKPGIFATPSGKFLKLVDFREDQVYDSVNIQIGTTSTAFGTELAFFDSQANKKKRDTNVAQAHKIPAGWEVVVMRLGLYAHTVNGNTVVAPADLKKFYENSSLEMRINDTLLADGWSLGYQVGVGLYGQTMETDQGVIAPGMPSMSSAPSFVNPQDINSKEHEIFGYLRFDAISWTTTAFTAGSMSVGLIAKLIMRGYVKRALGKG